MTFHEIFNAEQLFLEKTKEILVSFQDNPSEELLDSISFNKMKECAVGLVFCSFASEALLNKLLKTQSEDIFRDHNRESVKEKIEYFKRAYSIPVDFGQTPWNYLIELKDARNWLAHHKYPEPGLLGSKGYVYSIDATGRPGNTEPEFSPAKTLTVYRLEKYYNAVLLGMRTIAEAAERQDEFAFLWSEKYEPFLYG